MNPELRYLLASIELRDATAESPGTLEGYAAKYDSETEIGGWFREVIRPGAFTRALAEGQDVRALWGHDNRIVLGRRSAGTLEVNEDATGLKFRVVLPDTQAGRDAATSIKRGDVDGMSFGFRAVRERWTEEEGKPELRELLDLDLVEISPVAFPAYPDTSVAKRCLETFRAERSAEITRNASCSLSVERERQEMRKLKYTIKGD